jgi:excisionase family DNA binding protein
MDPITQPSIKATLESLVGAIKNSLTQPVCFQVSKGAHGNLTIKQVCFLSVDELADLARVERRTVYAWVERADENGLKFYRPPGSRGILFELSETLDWLKGGVRE